MYVAQPEIVDEEERTVTVVEQRRPRREMQTYRPGLPVPSTRVATAVAVGTALQVGVALLARYMAGSAPKAAPRRSIARRVVSSAPIEVQQAQPQPPTMMDDGIIAVVESVTFRRTWLRRG